ncbi:hypothetical protein [Acinetobacter wuhouensis]|uniref:Uncharacterized protein n=1 Tax=Acinetobacter wuhouensis TaxID=1879050 RepID=A0A4Q7AGD8_9GAMM|nr:hypothetical protein [Acinetobacter wuhouensis]RZG44562.1 hypothetical protein EXU28_14215 [Acinetobacter wuhouensis]RZG73967.1 hypothetical protein EXU29_05745 [Acinetobacter wuhouensis]
MMNVDFTRPFATQILKSGNILDEYQLGQTLIYIEYNNKKQLTDLYTRIKNRYLDDYKRIPQINQFAHNIFLNRHPEYKSLFDNQDSTCLIAYSFHYYFDENYIEYDCYINHDFSDITDEILEFAAIFIRYKDGKLEEACY